MTTQIREFAPMHERLIGYLLGALDTDETNLVEEELRNSRLVRRQLDILRISLGPLEPDREHCEAPAGLAARTCQRIDDLRSIQSD